MRACSFVLSLLFCLATFATVSASHFRYANFWLRQHEDDPYTVSMEIVEAWRFRDDWDIEIGGLIQSDHLWVKWGDGDQEYFSLQMDSYSGLDPISDWVLGHVTLTHTYDTLDQYDLFYEKCCRVYDLEDGNDGNKLYVPASIDLRNYETNRFNPRVTSVPIVPMILNEPNTYEMPVEYFNDNWIVQVSPEGSDPPNSGLTQATPNGMVISKKANSKAVVYEWTPTAAGLYAVQVLVSEGTSLTPVDFIFQVIDCENGGSACPDTPHFFENLIGLNGSNSNIGVTQDVTGTTITCEVETSTVLEVIAVKPPTATGVKVTTSNLPEGFVISECEEGVSNGGYSHDDTCTARINFTAVDTGEYTVMAISRTEDGIDSPTSTINFIVTITDPVIQDVRQSDGSVGFPAAGGVDIQLTGKWFGGIKELVSITVGGLDCPIVGPRNMTMVTKCTLPEHTVGRHDVIITVDGKVSNAYDILLETPNSVCLDANGDTMGCIMGGGCFTLNGCLMVPSPGTTVEACVTEYDFGGEAFFMLPNEEKFGWDSKGNFVYHNTDGTVCYSAMKAACAT